MSHLLPTPGFPFLQPDKIATLPVHQISDEAKDEMAVFEVDLRLHEADDALLLATESFVIDRSMYSPNKQTVFPEAAPQI